MPSGFINHALVNYCGLRSVNAYVHHNGGVSITCSGFYPTHVAVALKYVQGKMDAPVVLAKGYDEVAQKIKAIAAEHGIPMVENVTLARALAREVQVGQPMSAWCERNSATGCCSASTTTRGFSPRLSSP